MTFTIDGKCAFYKRGGHTVKEWIFFGKDQYIPETFTFQASYRNQEYSAEKLSRREYESLCEKQQHTPIYLLTVGHRKWWWFRDEFYFTTDNFQDPLLVKGLLIEKQDRMRRKAERARTTATGERPSSESKAKSKANGEAKNAPKNETASPYTILDIPPNATFDEIKKAYRKKIMEYHPDRVASLGPELKRLVEEMTKKINTAFAELERIQGQ
jgi:hypothetical protein